MHTHSIERNTLGIRQSAIVIVLNLVLFVLKFSAGVRSDSVALLADAWHVLSDSLSSLVLLLCLWIGTRSGHKGHVKQMAFWEHGSSVLIGCIVLLMSSHFLLHSWESLSSGTHAHYDGFSIWVVVISILVKAFIGFYARMIYSKTQIMGLKAIAWHNQADAFTSVLILAGMFLGHHYHWIDAVMGLIISLMLAIVGIELIWDAYKHFRAIQS